MSLPAFASVPPLRFQIMSKPTKILSTVVFLFSITVSFLIAQGTPPPTATDSSAMELVRVNWFEEMVQGGITMVALGLLSVALVVVVIERMMMLRTSKFIPKGLVETVCALIKKGDWEGVSRACRRSPSLVSHAIIFIPQHLGTDRETLMAGAGDIAAREMARSEQRLGALSLIAGLAPLLGLLGTMIGMIESFKLVEVFGDEGGASMLAGSISKALITTAAGLILAMPALIAHYIFKRKTQEIASEVESALESVSNAILITQLQAAAEPIAYEPEQSEH